ncbi:MAG TPA: alpha-amylase family glycosyl hydrolase [Ferruginibacter sp.]|nr:alpha-amylase family glycosyl hydrolase [Ferruginibacter sp.]
MRMNKLLVLIFIFFVFVTAGCNEETKKETAVSETAIQDTHPSWAAQSNIYEVNLRQYSTPGSVKEFEKHLPRLKEMGVEVLWFMPVTPIGKEGRKMKETELGSYYAVRDYKGFNEEFGTMDDWKTFVKNAHSMGFRVITDWVANHSAIDNHWTKAHPDFYAKDSAGKTISPYDWTDVLKLDYSNRELRDSMIDAMKFWITETGIDGFRCDVAEDVPVDFWKDCITELKKTKNVFMLAEGEKPELYAAGFDITYAWNIMREMTDLYAGKKSLIQFDSALNADLARFPPDAYRMYFTSNHDENSWNGTEFEKYGTGYKAFAVFTQTIHKGIPLIYSGQEIANKKRLKFFVKDTIAWDGKFAMAPFYTTLLKLRKSNPALSADASYKKLSSSNDAGAFAYQREKDGHRVVVILNLSKQPQKFNIKDVSGEPMNVFMGVKEKLSATHEFSIEPWGFIVYDYQ